jgi:hypothetical protein
MNLPGFRPQLEASGQHGDRLADSPDHLGRFGPGFQVLDGQRRGPVSGRVLLAGLAPTRGAVEIASRLEMACFAAHRTSLAPILPVG